MIPFPISSAPGAKPQEGGGRLINCYAEKTEPGARAPVVWKRSPGLRQKLFITGHSHLRGAILVSSTLILILDSRAYNTTSVFSQSNLGALSGSARVTVAKNNAGTPNIVCVTENGAFNLFTGSAPTSFADSDLPQPNSVCDIDGYLIFSIADGRIFATGLNAVTVASNSFTTEQGLSLRRVVKFRGELFAFGDKWTGLYRNAGTSPFPLERQFTIPRGICGTHAIAGWEEGWTNDLIWVGEDSVVYRMNGYTPEPISTPDVVRSIETATSRSLLEASVYMHNGNAFWVLTSPGEWTWEYNQTTKNWNERKSFNDEDWRLSCTVWAFDQWLSGDRATGKLFKIDGTYFREADDPLILELQTGIVANFPAKLGAPRVDFDITAAVGLADGENPVQTDPVVQISWSDDGGYSFNNPVNRAIGGEGESIRNVTVLRTGVSKAKGRRYKLRVSDPVHVGIMGGQTAASQRGP